MPVAKTQSTAAAPREVRSALRHDALLPRLTRLGFIAKGLVYLLVGGLALMLATLGGGETTDARGALRTIAQQPFGAVVLIAAAAGLFAFAAWQLIAAVFNTEREGANWGGRIKRIVYFFSFVAHGGLAFYALEALRGRASRTDETRAWTVWLMDFPLGTWLVMLIGLGLVIGGGGVIFAAFRKRFLKDLRTGEMSRAEIRWATRAGIWGNSARGIVFAIIGLFMLSAGWWESPRKVKGFEGALDTLAAQPAGNLLLASVAIGLALFGVYSFVEARYRKIRS